MYVCAMYTLSENEMANGSCTRGRPLESSRKVLINGMRFAHNRNNSRQYSTMVDSSVSEWHVRAIHRGITDDMYSSQRIVSIGVSHEKSGFPLDHVTRKTAAIYEQILFLILFLNKFSAATWHASEPSVRRLFFLPKFKFEGLSLKGDHEQKWQILPAVGQYDKSPSKIICSMTRNTLESVARYEMGRIGWSPFCYCAYWVTQASKEQCSYEVISIRTPLRVRGILSSCTLSTKYSVYLILTPL